MIKYNMLDSRGIFIFTINNARARSSNICETKEKNITLPSDGIYMYLPLYLAIASRVYGSTIYW